MNTNNSVYVPEGSFSSRLIPVSAVLSALAAVAGILSAILLFTPGAINYIDITGGTFSAKLTWTIIHIIVLVFFTAWAALSAVALFSAKTSKIVNGMDLFCQGTRILRSTLAVIGLTVLIIFVLRCVVFSAILLKTGNVINFFYLLSALLAEILLAAITAAIIILLRRFLDTIGNTAASAARTVTTGILRAPSVSMASAIGCLVMGIGSVVLGAGRMSAVSACAAAGESSLFSFMLRCAAALFFLSGLADALMFLYLRKYKHTSDYLLFKGTPVTTQD